MNEKRDTNSFRPKNVIVKFECLKTNVVISIMCETKKMAINETDDKYRIHDRITLIHYKKVLPIEWQTVQL